jgi:hypothetical protein
MKNVLIARFMLNDNGWELVQEAPSTSNTWSIPAEKAIQELLNSGTDVLELGDTVYQIQK